MTLSSEREMAAIVGTLCTVGACRDKDKTPWVYRVAESIQTAVTRSEERDGTRGRRTDFLLRKQPGDGFGASWGSACRRLREYHVQDASDARRRKRHGFLSGGAWC
jgi:hypothetical protein